MLKRLKSYSALAAPALLLAGCGTGQFNGMSTGGALAVYGSASSIPSNGQASFRALLRSGDSANVAWTVVSGNNASSLGQGHISAQGIYTPPGALSRDRIEVQVAAALASDPAVTQTALIEVTPGFVQPLLPENAALTSGGTLDVTAEIAEVNAGTVEWSLESRQRGNSISDLGSLNVSGCQRTLDQFTRCKVSYLAPANIPENGTVYLVGSVNGTQITSPLKILLNPNGINSSPQINQSAQDGRIVLGGSGSNDNDFDTYRGHDGESYIADCCGGTLGALVEDSAKNQYVLSNNHVLAESDQAKVGDAIDSPGLIDNGCMPASRAGSTVRPVATLKYFLPLADESTNVDAALAAVAQGAVDPSGPILQMGSSVRDSLASGPPVAGNGEALNAANLGELEVAKSGRTTGLTCSTVDAVDLSVRIEYYKDCAETQPYTAKTFTGQIGIAGDSFSDSGDSGALIVDATNAQPVGLFFAGGTDGSGNGMSVANPIGDVLKELSASAGTKLTVAGTDTPHPVACIRYDNATQSAAFVPAPLMARAKTVAETAGAALVNRAAGVFSVAAGRSLDSPGEAAIIVYTDKSKGNVAVPATVGGLRTQVVATDEDSIARDRMPPAPAQAEGIHLSQPVLNQAENVVRQYAKQLMQDPAIFGAGVAQSLDDPTQPAVLVLVDMDKTPESMPLTIGGLRVRYRRMHHFHVTRSKYLNGPAVSSCSLRGIPAS
ncbi:hypothetical protein [Silvibacterium acidisoli]|uniref:hypothetical protein n=1 Tax=Acidobacteriaceae bacterium ZG23-2 TaxID=2883246 RepID=UPI00406D25A7